MQVDEILSASKNCSPNINILSGQLWRAAIASATTGTAAATTITDTAAVAVVAAGVVAAPFGILM